MATAALIALANFMFGVMAFAVYMGNNPTLAFWACLVLPPLAVSLVTRRRGPEILVATAGGTIVGLIAVALAASSYAG
jgi:hypothetical protein